MARLNPNDLRSLINKDQRFQRAAAIIRDSWEDLML